MNFVTIIFKRLQSENPQLFKILSYLSLVIGFICGGLWYLDTGLEFSWMTDKLCSFLKDTALVCIGIFTTSNLTTTDKDLQKEKL